MICSACGATVAARFCGQCGAIATPTTATPGAPSAVDVTPAPPASFFGSDVVPLAWVAGGASRANRVLNTVPGLRSALEGPYLQRILLGVGGSALAVVAVAVGITVVSGPKHTLNGTFSVITVPDSGCGLAGSNATTQLDRLSAIIDGETFPCAGGPGGGYSDLADGTAVSVSDGAGKLLGTGALAHGTQRGGEVTFDFSVAEIGDADFYRVEIAHRGELPYSRQALDDAGWTVAASIN